MPRKNENKKKTTAKKLTPKKTVSAKKKVVAPAKKKLMVKKKTMVKKKIEPKKTVKKPVKKVASKIASKKPVKKVIPEKREAVKPTEAQIENLLTKGRSRNFVTETELLYIFPEVEEYIFDYEIFLERLQRNGIHIVEDTGFILDIDGCIGTFFDKTKRIIFFRNIVEVVRFKEPFGRG